MISFFYLSIYDLVDPDYILTMIYSLIFSVENIKLRPHKQVLSGKSIIQSKKYDVIYDQ